MTQRERYLNEFVARQNPDDLPLWGDWISVYETWLPQGLPPIPEGGNRREHMRDVFGFEGVYSAFWGTGRLPVHTDVLPGFTRRELFRDENHVIYVNESGITVKEMRDQHTALVAQQYLDHALHGREDWDQFRDERLQPDAPGRYPDEGTWKKIVSACRDRDTVVTIDGGSFYGYLRNWMGVEALSYAMYDDPEWVAEAADTLADFYIRVLERAVTDVPDIDACMFWEDMCFKNGPLCSPAMFRRFFLTPYQKVTQFLKDHGVRSFWVDCDGNIEKLIDLFIEGGVNGFYPLEVAAGMDAVKLKQAYGDRILLWGNIDKREIAKGGAHIRRELERVAPAVRMGGFIPLVDHGVPDDVSLANYRDYDRLRREMFGIRSIPRRSGEGG
ncbi:MAG: uroporphyrinogen decarboxylase family protein [Christensenellales bacterium]